MGMNVNSYCNSPYIKGNLYTVISTNKYGSLIGLKYHPKKYEPKSNQQSNNNESSSLNTLSEEQKKELSAQLNSGQGNMSMEQWDDFLLSLVDFGLITNNDRMQALGLWTPTISQETLKIGSGPVSPIIMDRFNWQWTGDPLKWLDQLDFSFKKECMYLEVSGYSTKDMSYIKERVSIVADIIKELMK